MTPTERDDDKALAEEFDRIAGKARSQAAADVVADRLIERAAMFGELLRLAEEYLVVLNMSGMSPAKFLSIRSVVDRARALQ